MAVSAFKNGMLKKNPFQGSSILDDPNRSGELSGLQGIYSEAKASPNAGREGMLANLAQKYRDFGMPQADRLNQIASERATAQATNYHDLGAESKLDAKVRLYKDYSDFWGNMQGAKNKVKDPFLKRAATTPGLQEDVSSAWSMLTDEERMAYNDSRTQTNKHPVSTWAPTKSFMAYYLPKKYSEVAKQQKDQQASIAQKYADLNTNTLQPLAEEEQIRKKSLADRANMYNEFLGFDQRF